MQGLIGQSKNKFFQTLLNLSNLTYYLLIGLNTFKMSPNSIKMAVFFSKKLQELPSGWELRLQTPTHAIMLKISKRLKCPPNGFKMAVFFFQKKIARIPRQLGASPPGLPYVSSCSKCQKLLKCHPNGVKMDFFLKTWKNCPAAGGFAPRPP